MDEVWGVARHPGQAPLLRWMVAIVLAGLLFTGAGFLWPGPEPPREPFAADQIPLLQILDREQWLEILRTEDLLRPDQFFLPQVLEEDLQRWVAEIEAYERHERWTNYARKGLGLCMVGLLWLGSLFVKRRPLPVGVRMHQLEVDGVALPWSEVRGVVLGARGCRVSTRDGQILLQGYVIEDKGELQRAATVALDHCRKRQGAVPPEMAALQGRIPERVRQ